MSDIAKRLRASVRIGAAYGDSGDSAIVEQQMLEAADKIERLGQWEIASQEGHPSPCTLGPLCPYCEIERLRKIVTLAEKMLNEMTSVDGSGHKDLAKRIADRADRSCVHERGHNTVKEE
jgi:hypothetical protein